MRSLYVSFLNKSKYLPMVIIMLISLIILLIYFNFIDHFINIPFVLLLDIELKYFLEYQLSKITYIYTC